MLYPILRGEFINQGKEKSIFTCMTNCSLLSRFQSRFNLVLGPRKVIQLGDKVVDFNPDFQLFLTTRNISPDIPPDISSSITLVNFITSASGLSGQVSTVLIQFNISTYL